jgi:hypothetical protein
MPDKSLYQKIKVLSFLLLIPAIILILWSFITPDEVITGLGVILLALPITLFSASYSIVNSNNNRLRKIAGLSVYICPVLILVSPFIYSNADITLSVFLSLIPFLLIVLTSIQLFLYDAPESLRSTSVLLILIIISIIGKKFHLPYSSIPFTIGISWFCIGNIMFAVRCLFISGNNRYFRYLTLFANSLIFFSLLAFLFKVQHWPVANIFIIISTFMMVIGTIIVMIILPFSGYIDWSTVHKKILKRILVPWAFIFFIFLFKYLIPEGWNAFWGTSQVKMLPGFGMVDYHLEERIIPEKK